MQQASTVHANSGASGSRPSAANAPAMIKVGTAGIGSPSCSMKTLMKTIVRPYCESAWKISCDTAQRPGRRAQSGSATAGRRSRCGSEIAGRRSQSGSATAGRSSQSGSEIAGRRSRCGSETACLIRCDSAKLGNWIVSSRNREMPTAAGTLERIAAGSGRRPSCRCSPRASPARAEWRPVPVRFADSVSVPLLFSIRLPY